MRLKRRLNLNSSQSFLVDNKERTTMAGSNIAALFLLKAAEEAQISDNPVTLPQIEQLLKQAAKLSPNNIEIQMENIYFYFNVMDDRKKALELVNTSLLPAIQQQLQNVLSLLKYLQEGA